MKNSVIIINAYFGKLPNYFQLWLNSCEKNEKFNWLIFIDDKTKYNYPQNVKVEYIDFNYLKKMIENKLDIKVNLKNTYKICDYRPAFGEIFSEYISEYDFWGHCDFDMIFGCLENFINDDILNSHDKIFSRGHLTLYKNSKIVNTMYKKNIHNINYLEIFSDKNNRAFDEWAGITKIFKENNLKIYYDDVIADVIPKIKKINISRGDNYKEQIFYYYNGHILRQYKINNEKKIDEFAYIHFQKRKMINNLDENSKNKKIYFIANEIIDENFISYNKIQKKNKNNIVYTIKFLKNELIKKISKELTSRISQN